MPNNLIVLAAGQGTRMQSDLPKVLHQVGGAPCSPTRWPRARHWIPSAPYWSPATGSKP